MINLSIIGVTGSIGTQTINLLKKNKDKYILSGISAHRNLSELIKIVKEFSLKHVAITDKETYDKFLYYIKDNNISCEVYFGLPGLIKICTLEEVNTVLTSVVGMVGLIPTMEAIKAGKNIALANKETLVVAGELIMKEARIHGVKILPVDSEHSAIFQCLQGNDLKALDKILLTASGGPFRNKSLHDLEKATLEEALNHPKWNMGKKISIDSATLMNKGLEVIEAHWLFNCPYDNIQVVVHPESIIHSMVQYKDGSIIAQMGVPDMTLPIQYALNYPNREDCFVKQLDLFEVNNLTFEKPRYDTFNCLNLAFEAGKKAGFYPAILNAANEASVELFLKKEISFMRIPELIEEALNKFSFSEQLSLPAVVEADKKVKDYIFNNY